MKYFDAFSGYGGFSLGITRAYEAIYHRPTRQEREKTDTNEDLPDTTQRNTWQSTPCCIGFSEIDKYAISVYKKHFPNHRNYGDITAIVTSDLPDFDLLTGGFPCQAFSVAGKRLGFEDTRGTLFFEVARILRDKRPRYFLLENVKGLLSHDGGKTFSTILEVLADLGYFVEWQVLNSKDFGVPQNRERVFIVGHLGGEPGQKVFPIGESDSRSKGGNNLIQLNNPTHSNDAYTVDSMNTGGVQVDSRIRRLTPKECERLQGLPDDWTKYGEDGEISDTQRYKLCGNGVTVNVVEEIIKQLTN